MKMQVLCFVCGLMAQQALEASSLAVLKPLSSSSAPTAWPDNTEQNAQEPP